MVQIVEMALDRFAPALYGALGVFLPLIAVNCAILGASLFMVERDYTLAEASVFGIGSGIGWARDRRPRCCSRENALQQRAAAPPRPRHHVHCGGPDGHWLHGLLRHPAQLYAQTRSRSILMESNRFGVVHWSILIVALVLVLLRQVLVVVRAARRRHRASTVTRRTP